MFPSNNERTNEMADCQEIQTVYAQLKKWEGKGNESLSGPFFRIPSISSSKQGVIIHKAAIILPFCRRHHLRRLNTHTLPIALGTRRCTHSSPDFVEDSLSLHTYVAHLFSQTMFPRLATGAAKHFVCFRLI